MIDISSFTWLFIVFFAVITFMHALSLKHAIRLSFQAHCRVMGTLWIVWELGIIALIVLLPQQFLPSPWMQLLGIIVVFAGVFIMIWHRLLLGRERLLGGRFFDIRYDTWIRGGLYRYFKNPLYDGVFLVFIGLFLWRGNSDFVILALLSLLLFNVFLASIESQPLSRHRA